MTTIDTPTENTPAARLAYSAPEAIELSDATTLVQGGGGGQGYDYYYDYLLDDQGF